MDHGSNNQLHRVTAAVVGPLSRSVIVLLSFGAEAEEHFASKLNGLSGGHRAVVARLVTFLLLCFLLFCLFVPVFFFSFSRST